MFDWVYQSLQKIGYTHPIHPTEVHMPIGLVVGALVFSLVALFFRRTDLWRTARHCLILAFIFLFPTVLFGYMDWQHYYSGAWLSPIKIKIGLAAVLAILLFVGIYIGRGGGEKSIGILVVHVLAFFMVVILGYYGGQLAFSGVGPKVPQHYQAGKKIFDANCSGCHPNGGNILKPTLPLRGAPQLTSSHTFAAFIRNPKNREGGKNLMPPFSQTKITNEQANELYQYIVHVINQQ